MKLLRAATLSVADIEQTTSNYCEWFDFSVEEQGNLDAALALSFCFERTSLVQMILSDRFSIGKFFSSGYYY